LPGRNLRVQVVLYGNSVDQVWRQLWGLAAAIRQAREAELLNQSSLYVGDSSPSQTLTIQDVDDLAQNAVEAGLTSFSYDFFGGNLGCSGGHNRLAEGATEEAILVLNPDTYPSPKMLVELIRAMGQPSVAAAEARQIPIDHPKDFNQRTGDTSWASGCCLLVARDVFETVGGFDAKYFPTYCNDVDFSWRVRLLGYRVVHVPRATVFHDKRISHNGHPELAPLEMEHSALGRLMLATKFGRPDIVAETIQSIHESGTAEQKLAVAEFHRREGSGDLPKPLPKADSVAQFIDGEYAVHRF